MRKKQFMALLLAGTLTVSMTPYIASAEFTSEMDGGAQEAEGSMEAPAEDIAVIGGVDGPTNIYVEDANNTLTENVPTEDVPGSRRAGGRCCRTFTRKYSTHAGRHCPRRNRNRRQTVQNLLRTTQADSQTAIQKPNQHRIQQSRKLPVKRQCPL